jgi:toxin FitB
MIILDTNVVSVMMRPETAPPVLDWLDTQPIESIWTTAITLFEIRYGLSVLVEGHRRRALEDNFERVLQEGLAERVSNFDTAAPMMAGDVMARMRQQGWGIELRDLQIAGIVAARRATLATGNIKHFTHAGIQLINPWD